MHNCALGVDETLGRILDQQEMPDRLHQAMRYACLSGGKKIRGFLSYTTALLYGVSSSQAYRVAAAIEAAHSYSLVHDDLPSMDDDDMRRGKPSLHRAFDEATATLAGDALLSLAFDILADPLTHQNGDIRSQLCAGLARATGPAGMVGGQILDLQAEGRLAADTGSTDTDLSRIHALKTGALISFSAQSGAILGGASEQDITTLARFGAHLGLAFQIADDVLDATQDSHTLGKTAGKDASQDKLTYVAVHGVSRARDMAGEQVMQAITAIGSLQRDVKDLEMLAQFVVDRKS